MYHLIKLPYLYQDLEPFIDTHTVSLHYNKHHQNYLNKLDNLLKECGYNYSYDINELVYHINEFPIEFRDDILFNLGGVLNHNLYWNSISQKGNMPTGELKKRIDKKYGSYDEFMKIFKKLAMSLKGSGYTFLVIRCDGELDIINMDNQDIPLLYGYIPLFNIDLWEHAYYLNYKYDKEKYIDNFMMIADFKNASKIFNSLYR